jgi:hypothetical protein
MSALTGRAMPIDGVRRVWPSDAVTAPTPTVSVAAPIAKPTRSPSTAPPSRLASWPTHAARDAGARSTSSSQVASAPTPSVAKSANGSGGTPTPSRKPISPASAVSGPGGSAAACARARPSTRSRIDCSSSSTLLALTVRSRTPVAPGICSCLSASDSAGGAPPPVGTATCSWMPPRCAWPGTGADASTVSPAVTVTTASAVPMRIGDSTLWPFFAARKIGTCASIDAVGSVAAIRTPRPMPT